MSNRLKRKKPGKKPAKKEAKIPSKSTLRAAVKRTWAGISAVGVVASLILTYLALTASVAITPVIELSSSNHFALPFRVKNSNILPIRDVGAEMVMKYVEDDHKNRFYNGHDHVGLRQSLGGGDYVDHVFESIQTDSKIIKGEIEVIVSYKLPLLPHNFADKKAFYARQQPDGAVRWLAQ